MYYSTVVWQKSTKCIGRNVAWSQTEYRESRNRVAAIISQRIVGNMNLFKPEYYNCDASFSATQKILVRKSQATFLKSKRIFYSVIKLFKKDDFSSDNLAQDYRGPGKVPFSRCSFQRSTCTRNTNQSQNSNIVIWVTKYYLQMGGLMFWLQSANTP
jgi:hypothetical protein